MNSSMTRRQMLGVGGSMTLAASRLRGAPAAEAARPNELRLGVCTYSLRNFQRRLAISMLKQLRTPYVSVKDFHLAYSITAGEAAKARADFERAGLTIVSGGVIPLADEDPGALKSSFEYARRCGMPMIIAAPSLDFHGTTVT